MSTGRTGISTCRRSCRRKAASRSPPTCRCRRSRSARPRSRSRAATSTGRDSATCIAIAAARPPWSTTRFRSIGRSTSRSRRVGGSYVRVLPRQSGEFDLVGWAAAQTGDWYGRSHRAASVALEGGHRWRHTRLQPWLRGGYLWASGDRNQDDDRHGTFFQMIALVAQVRAVVGLRADEPHDAFAQLIVEPRGLEARIEVHALQLASGRDLWYQGSGATASKSRFIGFSGRAAGGPPLARHGNRSRRRRADPKVLVDQRLRGHDVRGRCRHPDVHEQALDVLVGGKRNSFLAKRSHD